MVKKDPIKIVGMIIIIVSAIILFSAFPFFSFIEQSAVKFGPVEIQDIPEVNAIGIFIGIVGIILGLIIYGKEKIKIFILR